jgi:hypothetical protein
MNSGRFRFPSTLPRKVELGFIRYEPMNHKSLQHRKLAKVHEYDKPFSILNSQFLNLLSAFVMIIYQELTRRGIRR